MSGSLGRINRVLTSSFVDGPGNRFVVFFQGCNLDCGFCHNPETIGVCTHCGLCIPPCPGAALRQGPDNDGVRHDPARCTSCDQCTTRCPQTSDPRANLATTEDLLEAIRGVRAFLSGVTASGGEATLQSSFLTELFRGIKRDPALGALHTLVNSNGMVEPHVWDALLPVMDGAILDLKAISPDLHQKLTGQTNELVLASIRHLEASEKLLELRFPVLPGLNTDPLELERIARFLGSLRSALPVTLIRFRRRGVRSKHQHLPEPTPDQLQEIQALFTARGIACRCPPEPGGSTHK